MNEYTKKLEQKINIKFKDQELFKKSLIHKSHNNTISGSVLKFWNWNRSLRIERFFKLLK